MSDWTDLQIEPDMDLVKDAAAHQLSEDIKDLRALLQAAQKENEEQARLLAMSADREEKMRDALEHIAGLDTSQAACAQYIPRHNWQHIYDDQGHRAVCSKCGAVLGRDYICCIPRQ